MTNSPKSALRVGLTTALVAFVTITFFQLAHQLAHQAVAETLESDSYIIQFGNFNVTSGEKSSDGFTVTDTVGQVAAGPYGAYGSSSFFLGSGFQYIYQINEFSFQITDTSIDLGELSPGSFSSGTHDLIISTRGSGGYSVYAYELHELQHMTSPTYQVPDTSCDSSCTISDAGIWSNPANPGFGFNMTGEDIPADFLDSSHYRPFANQADNDQMQVVMSSNNIAADQQSTVTYKAAISGTQAAGKYETAIVYVAVPGY